MYERKDFLRLKTLNKNALKEEYELALYQYDVVLEHTDFIEENPIARCFGKPVYAMTVKEITDVMANVERYITAICAYLDVYEESEIKEVPITLPKNKKRRGFSHVLL